MGTEVDKNSVDTGKMSTELIMFEMETTYDKTDLTKDFSFLSGLLPIHIANVKYLPVVHLVVIYGPDVDPFEIGEISEGFYRYYPINIFLSTIESDSFFKKLDQKIIEKKQASIMDTLCLAFIAGNKTVIVDVYKKCLSYLNNSELFADRGKVKAILKKMDFMFSGKLSPEDLADIRSNHMPTIYEEGIQVGIQVGIQKGRKNLILEAIKNFSGKMTDKEIIEGLKVPEKEFQEIKKELENMEKEGKQ